MRGNIIYGCMIVAGLGSGLFGLPNLLANDLGSPAPFIKYNLSKNEFYAGESVILSAQLYSPSPDVVDIKGEPLQAIDSVSGFDNFDTMFKISDTQRFHLAKVNGVEYYVYPLFKYAVQSTAVGPRKWTGEKCSVAIRVPAVVNDPFWGQIRTVKTEWIPIKNDTLYYKVKDLPLAADYEEFSGAVGNYKISLSLPVGNIVVNEVASALITISGEGIIPETVLPDYQNAFKNGIKLKSVEETTDMEYRNNVVISNKTLECEFMPLRRDNCEIGVVKLCFFNPHTGKYEIAESQPIKINVKSATINRELKDV